MDTPHPSASGSRWEPTDGTTGPVGTPTVTDDAGARPRRASPRRASPRGAVLIGGAVAALALASVAAFGAGHALADHHGPGDGAATVGAGDHPRGPRTGAGHGGPGRTGAQPQVPAAPDR